MNDVEISVLDMEPPEWIEACKKFVENLLRVLGLRNWEISLAFCNNDRMRSLNKQYRNIDETTDVLSFSQGDVPADGGSFFAGDIVISLETLAAQAAEFGVTMNEELKRLIIHGILHLMGMDHETNDTGEEMLKLQESLLVQAEENIF